MKQKILLVSVFLAVALATAVVAALISSSPAGCSGEWAACSNAFANDANRATAAVTATSNKSGIWNNYTFTSIPAGSAITGVVVRSDFFASKASGYLAVRVSADGGATYGPVHTLGGNTAEKTFQINVTTDFAWTLDNLNRTNLRVNATCFKNGSGQNPTCNLDWIPVNVTYDAPFNFAMTMNPSAKNITPGATARSNVTVSLSAGIPQNVALTVPAGCPPDSTCVLNQTSGLPTYKAELSVTTSATTPLGTYKVNVTGTNGTLEKSAVLTLTVI
jgi:hypothetical protein